MKSSPIRNGAARSAPARATTPITSRMLAAYIGHYGEAKATAWLRGVKANLARKPQGNDRAQVKAIMEGVCDIAVGNHYYMALMLKNDKQKPWAASANLVFPTLAGKGTHMNVSGVMMTKHRPQQGKRHQADGIPDQQEGPGHLCQRQ